jgi:hypothetical protein
VTLDIDSYEDLLAEADAGITWVSGTLRWTHVIVPALMAALGVACVAGADMVARQGTLRAAPLWWAGVLLIFVPAAATLLFVKVSRSEALSVLIVVAFALYAVKLLYAPGTMWGFDELLHYRTVDDILTTGHLFANNTLLPVSPFYPGMETIVATIVQLTGLSIVESGFIVIGVVRLLTVVSLFLLLERTAMPSRFAAPATLLYMACPAFLYFDSMFSYESLAIALSMVCLFRPAGGRCPARSPQRRRSDSPAGGGRDPSRHLLHPGRSVGHVDASRAGSSPTQAQERA